MRARFAGMITCWRYIEMFISPRVCRADSPQDATLRSATLMITKGQCAVLLSPTYGACRFAVSSRGVQAPCLPPCSAMRVTIMCVGYNASALQEPRAGAGRSVVLWHVVAVFRRPPFPVAPCCATCRLIAACQPIRRTPRLGPSR